MVRYSFEEIVKSKIKKNIPTAVAIGVFDIVHLGHQQIFQTLTELKAGDPNLETMVITFSINPKGAINLDTLALREKYLAPFNINSFTVIDFSIDFGKLSGVEFIRILLDALDLKTLVVGEDFKAGRPDAFISAIQLKDVCASLGKNVNVVIKPPVKDELGRKISSSVIREYVLQGKVELVPRFTLRPYQVDLAPIPSDFTSSALRLSKRACLQLLPPPGMYNGVLVYEDLHTLDVLVTVDDEYIFIRSKTSEHLRPLGKKDLLSLISGESK